jgi:hypothetical protein
MDGDLDSLFDPGVLGGGDRGQAFVLRFLAAFAAFGRILQVLVAKELLLSGRPNEILTAIDTTDIRVLKFTDIVRFGGVLRIFGISNR